MIRRLRNVGLGALLAGGFYVLLIDTSSLPELYVIPAVLLVAGAGFGLATRLGHTGYRLPVRELLAGWRAVAHVPRDMALVVWELADQLAHPRSARGSLRSVRIPDPGDDESTTIRAAISESLGSLAPNTIVIGYDRRTRRLLVHQLHHQGSDAALDPLGEA